MKDKFSWWDLLKSIWMFLDENKTRFVVWNLIIFICYFFKLVPPLILGLIVDFFISYSKGDSLYLFYVYCITITILYIIVSMLRLSAKGTLGGIGIKTRAHVRIKGFERLMDFSLRWHDKENSGSKVQRINNGARAMKEWIHMLYSDLLPIITTFIGVIVVFIFLDVTFLLFFVVYLAIFFSIEFYFNRNISRLNDEKNRMIEKASGTYFESTNNILSIKTLGAKGRMARNVEHFENLTKEVSLKLRDLGIMKWKFFQTLNGLSLGLFIYLVGLGVMSSRVTAGSIIIFYTYFNQLRRAAEDITKIINKVIENRSMVKRMMPLFTETPDSFFGKKSFPARWKALSFEDVDFSYKEGERTFRISGLSLKISRKEKVGIVGESGSGKSTLAKLLMGLYPIDSGRVRIGKTDFYDVSHKELTQNITIVLQETELFNLSLKDNITLLKDVSSKVYEAALEVAQLKGVVKKLPEKDMTLIGEKGYRLSGGERQRVGIARAICRPSQILILDEATSSLDSITEKRIQKGLEEHFRDKTIIIVAHRISTLKGVDRIIVFDKGRIVEQGKFSELSRNSRIFRRLWNQQKRS